MFTKLLLIKNRKILNHFQRTLNGNHFCFNSAGIHLLFWGLKWARGDLSTKISLAMFCITDIILVRKKSVRNETYLTRNDEDYEFS
jgi:hypothetical protein